MNISPFLFEKMLKQRKLSKKRNESKIVHLTYFQIDILLWLKQLKRP